MASSLSHFPSSKFKKWPIHTVIFSLCKPAYKQPHEPIEERKHSFLPRRTNLHERLGWPWRWPCTLRASSVVNIKCSYEQSWNSARVSSPTPSIFIPELVSFSGSPVYLLQHFPTLPFCSKTHSEPSRGGSPTKMKKNNEIKHSVCGLGWTRNLTIADTPAKLSTFYQE